ncbi:DNA-directed RNA polymerase subunit beta [Striga asiatica]|uniref:DNA-directed RNA polymerase subunit beta n=1 Tax=Striga asiatica TaxID=4170 RepID=A0A5A7P480_STRAF|nr:DNA-directed RNA polymerase subunit beta [Striga asiatica]
MAAGKRVAGRPIWPQPPRRRAARKVHLPFDVHFSHPSHRRRRCSAASPPHTSICLPTSPSHSAAVAEPPHTLLCPPSSTYNSPSAVSDSTAQPHLPTAVHFLQPRLPSPMFAGCCFKKDTGEPLR